MCIWYGLPSFVPEDPFFLHTSITPVTANSIAMRSIPRAAPKIAVVGMLVGFVPSVRVNWVGSLVV